MLIVQSIRILLALFGTSSSVSQTEFVDDNNISNTGEKYKTICDILKKTQDDAQFWNDLITSSGARLELAKCFTQIIQFEFTLSGAPVISAPEEGLNLTLINHILDFEFPIDPISPYDT